MSDFTEQEIEEMTPDELMDIDDGLENDFMEGEGEPGIDACEFYDENPPDFITGRFGLCRDLTPLELKLWLWTIDCMKITGEVPEEVKPEDLLPPGMVEILPSFTGGAFLCGRSQALACAIGGEWNIVLIREGHIDTFHFDNSRGTIWLYIHEFGHIVTNQISGQLGHAFRFYTEQDICIFRFTGQDQEFIDAEICEFE